LNLLSGSLKNMSLKCMLVRMGFTRMSFCVVTT
jgi:hypothetical protein